MWVLRIKSETLQRVLFKKYQQHNKIWNKNLSLWENKSIILNKTTQLINISISLIQGHIRKLFEREYKGPKV